MSKYLAAAILISSASLFAEQNCCCYPPQYYNLQCDCGLYASVDFLYWFSSESHLTYAATTRRFKNLDVEWDPGVRAGLGFNFACDGWDIFLSWTYFKNTNKESTTSANLLNPWTSNPALRFDKVSADWEFHLNLLDLELGRRYWLSPCFNMRPFIFLRGAWTETCFDLDSTVSGILVRDDFNNRFWGGGFGLGVQPAWYFTSCFYLYGDFAFSLLWGDFQMKKKGTLNSFSVETRSNMSGIEPIADLGIGLGYDQTYCDCRYRTLFSIGWEHHYWWDYVQRFKRVSNYQFFQTSHSLGFGGLVVRARLDF